LTIRQYP